MSSKLSSRPTTLTITAGPGPLPWAPLPGTYTDASIAPALSVDPCPSNRCVYSGTQGMSAVFSTWNGGAFAPTLGSYGSMLYFGGGHFGYDGNSVFAFDVGSRSWIRLNEPAPYGTRNSGDSETVNVLVDPTGAFPDGSPYPNHTNMACDFLPPEAGGGPLGSYVFMGHDQTGVNITSNNLWRFDLSSRKWSKVLALPQRLGDLLGLCYDSTRRGLWVLGSLNSSVAGPLWFISVVDGTVSQIGAGTPGGRVDFGLYANLTYVPSRDCLVIVARGNDRPLRCVDLNGVKVRNGATAPSFTIRQSGAACESLWLDGSGATWQQYANSDKPEYCSLDGNLYALDLYSKGECRLFRLAPPNASRLQADPWTWTSEILAPRNATGLALRSLPYGGTNDARLFGKMRFVPGIKSFVFCDASDRPAQALRPIAFA